MCVCCGFLFVWGFFNATGSFYAGTNLYSKGIILCMSDSLLVLLVEVFLKLSVSSRNI